jgi:hypothetical protein
VLLISNPEGMGGGSALDKVRDVSPFESYYISWDVRVTPDMSVYSQDTLRKVL